MTLRAGAELCAATGDREMHNLCLEWVEGTFPTPYGVIRIRHDKDTAGNIKSQISAPNEIKIIR